MRRSRGLLAAVLLVACRAAAGGATPEVCAPPTTKLSPSSTSAGLAGDYQLTLVATSGAKSGGTAEGKLALQPQSEALRYRARPGGIRDSSVTHPLYGSTDLDLSAVDAISVGSTTSTDALQPGVLVIERHRTASPATPAEITIRLGSEANRRDRQRIEGGYMALRVRQVSPERISGTWASGVTRERAAGYFCAVRKDGKDGKDGRD